MNKRRNIVILSLALLVITTAVISWQSCKPKPQITQRIINVGYLPIYVDLPLFVAKEKGFFENRGISVELKRYEQSPDIASSLANAQIDFGASVATASVLAVESRDPNKLKIFLVDAENKENYLSSFVVLKDSGIKEPKDLKGKKIASFPGPAANTFGKMVLEKLGINPQTDVQWSELPASNHLSALESKTVDALFTYEPTATQAVLEKNAVKLIPGAVEANIIEPWQAGVWVVTADFQRENPELAKQFILAIYDAVDYIRQNPNEAKKSLEVYTSIKSNVALASPNIPFTKLSEVDTETLQKHADILTEKQILSTRVEIAQMLLPSSSFTK